MMIEIIVLCQDDNTLYFKIEEPKDDLFRG